MKVDATEIVSITMSDGVTVAAAIYRPTKPGRYPALFAASPYRFDNNNAPDVPIFLWHETGPIAWYVERGYAYVHLDVRGSGRSGGEFRFLDKREQRDLYEVIEWIAAAAVVQRQSGRYRSVLLRNGAMVHGDREPAASRLHRAVRRAGR